MFNTGNPVPSTDPRDLFDNAQAFDAGMNSPNLTFIGRLGQTLQSWAGAVGYQMLGDYTDGTVGQFTMTNFNQVFRRGGEFWRVSTSAGLPYTTTGNWASESSKFVSVGDAVLRNALAAGGGAAMIGWLGTFAGAQQITQALKNEQFRHINDFPSTPANTWLQRAIAGTPAGGVLHLGRGPYIGNYTESRSGITLLGVGPAPLANSTRSALNPNTGTIVQGFTKYTGSDVKVLQIGFDNGADVTTALNAGVEKDCLVMSNAGISTTPNTNNHIINCTTLAKVGATAAHSCLFENVAYGSAQNVVAYGGFVGFVSKTQDSFFDNIVGRRNLQSGIQFKSSSYAIWARNTIGTCFADDEGLNTANSVGIFIYAESAQLQGLRADSLSTKGWATGVGQTMISGFPMNDISIGSVSCEVPNQMGFSAFGGIVNSSIGNVQVIKSVSGKSVFVNDDVLGIRLGNIQAVSPGADLDDSVRLGGVFDVGGIQTSINYAPGTSTGITVVPFTGSPRAWSIGNYRGRLMLNSGAGTSYLNGWTSGVSSPASCQLNGNQAFLGFCVTKPGTIAGAEGFYQVRDGLRPSKPIYFNCLGYQNASGALSGTTVPVPITGLVSTNGTVSFPFLSNPTAFPTNIVFVVGQVSWSLL